MKCFITSILSFLAMSLSLQASQPLKIGIITDLHYLSEQLMGEGKALDKYMDSSGRTIRYTPALIDKIFDGYENDSPIDVLLVTGDLTKDGERQSHIDLAEKLKKLKDCGIRVYVIPGNHDINMPASVGFKGDNTYRTDNISAEQFAHIYNDFGYASAIKRDSASLSYVVQLGNNDGDNEKVWLLAIDAARYDEYTTTSITGGHIKPVTEQWIIDILREAKSQNIKVLGMMHWGLVEHMPYQSTFFPQYLIDDHMRLASLLADEGLRVLFTGHFHTNDVTAYTSLDGNTIYDVETGTLSSYPYSYRFADLYSDRIEISTRNIYSVPANPHLFDQSRIQLQSLTERIGLSMLRRYGFDTSDDVSKSLAKVIAEIFIIHAFGDEVMTSQLRSKLEALSENMDVPIGLKDMELDFPPADNNLTIRF